MLLELLVLFIIITVVLFIIIIEQMFCEESKTLEQRYIGRHVGNWRMAVPLIAVNFIFIVLVAFGFHNVEWFYMKNYWIGNGTYLPGIYVSEVANYDVYAWVYVVFFLIHVVLLFVCGFYAWFDALSTKGRTNDKGRWW